MSDIVDISKLAKIDPAARSFLSCMSVGREVKDALEMIMPGLAPNEQKVMMAVVSFRIMGGMLPASLEMMRRLPMFEDMKPENIGIACDFLAHNGVLSVVMSEDQSESAFMWEALERLLMNAVTNANTSGLVGTDGARLY